MNISNFCILSCCLIAAALIPVGQSFAPSSLSCIRKAERIGRSGGTLLNAESKNNDIGRKNFLQIPGQLALANLLIFSSPKSADAAVYEQVALTPQEAEVKFHEGYKTITYLLDTYEEIGTGGGDNVRRYLGTVVTNPPSSLVVGIDKTMKALEGRADGFVEFNEMSEEVIKSITQGDGSAYMSIFSKRASQKFLDDGKIEVRRCKKAMEDLADMIDIKL